MLQATGYLGLEHEAGAAGGVVGMRGEDLFEGDLAFQFCIKRDENSAQSASCEWPQHTEALAVRNGRPNRELAGLSATMLGVELGWILTRVGVVESRLVARDFHRDFGRFHGAKAGLRRLTGRIAGNGCLVATTLSFELLRNNRLDCNEFVRAEVSTLCQVAGQWARLVPRPELQCRKELRLIDQAIIESNETEREGPDRRPWASSGKTKRLRRPQVTAGRQGSSVSVGPSPIPAR